MRGGTLAKKDQSRAGSEMSYEEIRSRLEAVVARLERGEGTLDESLALYEEGISLIRAAHRILDAAEKRLEILKPRADGSFGPEPADPDALGSAPEHPLRDGREGSP